MPTPDLLAPTQAPLVDVWSSPPVLARPEDNPNGIGELPLSFYWALLARYRWRIVSFVTITTLVLTLYTLSRPKQYDATVMMRVDPLSSPLVGQDQRNGQIDPNLMVATEAQVLTSPAVMQATIDKLNLGADPEFAAPAPGTIPPAKLLESVTKRVSVDQPSGTVLLNLTFRSHRPELSALVANTIAAQFLVHEDEIRARTLADSSRAMSGQLDTMRAAMESDQTKLVNYEAQYDVIDADDKSNIYQSRLSAINNDLSQAQSVRIGLEAEFRMVTQPGLDAILASKLGEQLLPRQQRLLTDQAKMAQYATVYGPRHPIFLQQQQIVAHDQQELQRGADLIRQQVEDQYRAALTREELIQAGLQRQKAAFDAFNLRAIQYRALKASSDSATRLYFDLQQRIQDAAVAAGLRSEDVAVVSPARSPLKPSAPHPLLIAVLAFFGSAILGVAVAIVDGLLDQAVSTPSQLEGRFGVHVLGALPNAAPSQIAAGMLKLQEGGEDGGGDEHPQHIPYQEAAYAIYSAMQFALGSGGSHSIAITSSLPGEGKSTLANYLAILASSLGHRTVIIDADLRKPNVHRLQNLPNRVGLSNVLRRKASLVDALQTRGTLSVLTAGPVPANPTELIHLGLSEILQELGSRYECIFVDCPPLLGFGESVKIVSAVDGVVVVAHTGATQLKQIASSLRQLNSVRARLLGLVLNRVSKNQDETYSYYYQDYYNRAPEEPDSSDPTEVA